MALTLVAEVGTIDKRFLPQDGGGEEGVDRLRGGQYPLSVFGLYVFIGLVEPDVKSIEQRVWNLENQEALVLLQQFIEQA
ncbi:MAG: hypothetical protein GC154_12005 [bacterium]|nr:hypothetical protein [bacterium]